MIASTLNMPTQPFYIFLFFGMIYISNMGYADVKGKDRFCNSMYTALRCVFLKPVIRIVKKKMVRQNNE